MLAEGRRFAYGPYGHVTPMLWEDKKVPTNIQHFVFIKQKLKSNFYVVSKPHHKIIVFFLTILKVDLRFCSHIARAHV